MKSRINRKAALLTLAVVASWRLCREPDPALVMVATTIAPEPGGGYRIGFIGNPGQNYMIQFATILPLSLPWQFLATRTADSTGHYSFVDSPPVGTARRFYRSIFP